MATEPQPPRGPSRDVRSRLEAVVRSFQQAWRDGRQPAIDDFLPADAAERRAVLFELVHADLVYRLSAGETIGVEVYLRRYPLLAGDRGAVVTLILREFALRQAREPDLSADDYLARYPVYAAELRARMQLSALSTRPEHETRNGTVAHHRFDAGLLTASVVPSGPGGAPPVIDGYELLEELGRGGMGVVYKARQLDVDRVVALKTVRADAGASAEQAERFTREMRAVARLRHPHIVPIYEVGRRQGVPFYTMAFVSGGTLARGRERFADPHSAVAVIEKLARALHYAHGQGVVHRDLKPSNVLLDEAGEPFITDFGLAKLPECDVELTRTGQVLGTPAYMAPEQAAGDAKGIGPATDVWGLGVLLYELLTGSRPFGGKTSDEMRQQILLSSPGPPRVLRPDLPRGLEAVVLKCLEREPRDRYSSAGALADDLERFQRGEPVKARPVAWPVRMARSVRRRPWAVVAVLLLALAAVVTIPLVTPAGDPDRPARLLHERLAAGETVTLLDSTGPPRWSRWAYGEGKIELSPLGDQTCYVKSFDASLLELLPGPLPERYRLRAELRQLEGGESGLYFAYRRTPTAQGVEHCYAELVVRDMTLPDSDVRLRLHRWREPGPLEAIEVREGTGITRRFETIRDSRPWRSLAVEVTPETIRLTWENQPLGTLSRPRLLDAAGRTLEGNPELDPQQQFQPPGAVGLVINRGSASFRNVILEPLQ